jgi:probable FeS assembly SUF system protein SufT
MREARTVVRDVEATVIPYGDKVTLEKDATVYVTQALGGSYTVMTWQGWMARIEGKDADAIGFEAEQPMTPESVAGRPVEELAWDQLRTCYDPEIPVNIVDLGLVYACEAESADGGGSRVRVRFTLTAPGCGMGDHLKYDIERKLLSIPGVTQAEVEVVFDPPWSQEMMSDSARLQLGLM